MGIRVLIVDDSLFMRKIISDILSSDNDIQIVGTAKNGKDALEKIELLSPDVITLDVEMPVMDGIECLTHIMNNYRIPVIMLSSITTEGADATVKALELGAIDFITKPTSIFNMGNEDKKIELIEKVKTAAKVKILKYKQITSNIEIKRLEKSKSNIHNKQTLIAIGTSTGGPKALQSIIPFIDKNINGSILVVQHMPPGFTNSLAKRLDSLSQIKVKEAEDGEIVQKGYCYIAPGGFHMKVEENYYNKIKIRLDQNEPVSGHRPSVDVMMSSVSKIKSLNKMGVILTGMGSDGAMGIKMIKESNGYTIAQDEETSVVFGMPKSAINTTTIDKVLPLDLITNEIINKVGC